MEIIKTIKKKKDKNVLDKFMFIFMRHTLSDVRKMHFNGSDPLKKT